MQHKLKVTVLRKELYKDLQKEYCADPNSGECPFYKVGDEFIFLAIKMKTLFGLWAKGNIVVKLGIQYLAISIAVFKAYLL